MSKLITRNSIGLILGLGVYLLICFLTHSKIDVAVLVSLFIVVLYFTFIDYKRIKRSQADLNDRFDKFIAGQDFIHGNICISMLDKSIVVNNPLLWIDLPSANEAMLEESLKSNMEDFDQLLASNQRINDYFKGKEVSFSLSEKDDPMSQKSNFYQTVKY